MLEDFKVWDGEYEKEFYDVRLPSGEIILCWPNSGVMNSLDGSGRVFRFDTELLRPIFIRINLEESEKF